MTVRVLTDSTCDLPAELITRLRISVLPIYIHIGNADFLDGIDITREEFFRNLPVYQHHPTTAVPSPAKFHALYDALADEGATEVLSIHISASLSGIIDVARIAAAETKSTAVTVFDSRQLSLGTGFLVQTAAELAMQGLSVKDILPVLEGQILRTHVAAGLDTLQFLRRSGRMNGAVSTIGELLQIKPLLTMYNGVSGVERVRTRQKAIARLAEMIHLHSPLEKIGFLHSGAVQSAVGLKDQVQHLLATSKVWLEMINPVLGAHIGPGAVGFALVSSV